MIFGIILKFKKTVHRTFRLVKIFCLICEISKLLILILIIDIFNIGDGKIFRFKLALYVIGSEGRDPGNKIFCYKKLKRIGAFTVFTSSRHFKKIYMALLENI